MEPGNELRILRDLAQQLEDPAAALRVQRRVNRWVYRGAWASLTAALMMFFGDVGPTWLAVLLATLSGFAAGAAVMHRQALQQWPVTLRYVDLDGVRARLAELEAD